jgi:hypothetical protein
MTDTKHLTVLPITKPSAHIKEPPRKKVAAKSDEWVEISSQYSTQETQQDLVAQLQPHHQDPATPAKQILLNHLKTKQSGYRQQDTLKGLYDPARFIQVPDIVALLVASNLSCFYCRKWATIFYQNVRDPRQWSLERLSNAEGHNRGNVVIACLECNMRRRTMYYERYVATKQLTVNKLGSAIEDSDQTI